MASPMKDIEMTEAPSAPTPTPITVNDVDTYLTDRIIARDKQLKKVAISLLSLTEPPPTPSHETSGDGDGARASAVAATVVAIDTELSDFEQTALTTALTAAAAVRTEARSTRSAAVAEASVASLTADLAVLRSQLAAAEAEAARRSQYAERERVIARLPAAPVLEAALATATAELDAVEAAERAVGDRVRKAEREARLLLRCVEDFEWSVDGSSAGEAVAPSLRGGAGWTRVEVPALAAKAEAAAAAKAVAVKAVAAKAAAAKAAAAKAAADAAASTKLGWAPRAPLVPDEQALSGSEEEEERAMEEV
ncbi:hypothetical protein BU14_0518s0010 [Porphyra umbilicalis]|uniref:Uncharacterized protein n=1 Tax=Porphyra umbilicalis TaxID=2786 RepID=A0A1X6NSQ2_PORUM|nr:hypothetical protein BU14_0518s0010 [Porphyra umbilicalis]|eukprot:OSX71618.1 hypothetical protein BU14_0518s0010 [Porphyra umbilicalis]